MIITEVLSFPNLAISASLNTQLSNRIFVFGNESLGSGVLEIEEIMELKGASVRSGSDLSLRDLETCGGVNLSTISTGLKNAVRNSQKRRQSNPRRFSEACKDSEYHPMSLERIRPDSCISGWTFVGLDFSTSSF
jgi:hypothetical protein